MKEQNKIPIWAEDRLDDLIERLSSIINENQRPASEVILDENDALSTLKICKRSLAALRAEGLISYSKVKGKLYYKLSDVLNLINSNVVNQITPQKRLFSKK